MSSAQNVPPPRIRFRPIEQADVDECLARLLPSWLELDASQRAGLPALWRRLVDAPSVVAGITEDLARPIGERLQGWGVTIALPPAWTASLALESALARHASSRVYAGLLDGTFTPLTERELGQANAGSGVTFLALHYCQSLLEMNTPYALALLNAANESFRVHHAGYRIAAFYQQGLLSDAAWITAAGFRLRGEWMTAASGPESVVMYGLTHAEAMSVLPGTSARHVFEHQPPRFRLSASQRRLLWLALFDDSDETLTATLAVSAHGLKKLWRGIYDRIEDAAADFFGNDGDDDGKRGREKRRQVLAYVRQRPEELRPWAAG